jgi:integrase/recombinase XerD
VGPGRSPLPGDEDRGREHSAFRGIGLDRKHWSSASPIRTLFKGAFAAAGLPYFNPHSFRKTLALLGGQICKSPEEYKAWSQNLGHENVLTTFSSYGDVALHRQAEIIRGLGRLSIASRFGDPDRQAVARI